MENKEYPFPEEAEESDHVSEPAMTYSAAEECFEQGRQRSIIIDEFKGRLLNKLLMSSLDEALEMEKNGEACSTEAAMAELDRRMQWK